MKFPFLDFWSRLIVKFGEYTYKSIPETMFKNRRLRIESEDNVAAHPEPGFRPSGTADGWARSFVSSPVRLYVVYIEVEFTEDEHA